MTMLKEQNMPVRINRKFLLLLLSMLALLPYLQGGLVWDDHILLEEGLWKEHSLLEIWGQSVQGGEIARQYYRPIPMTLMALLPNVFILHCLTLFLHIASAGILERCLRIQFSESIAGIGMLIFVLHPIQTEVLGWVSCLPDILAVHFSLWSIYCVLSNRRPFWVGVTLLLGLLSKEIALVPIVAWMLMTLVRHYRDPSVEVRRDWLGIAGLTMILVLVLRIGLGVETVFPTTWDAIPRTTFVTVGMGWFAFLWPFPYFPIRDVWELPMWQVGVGWSLCLWSLWKLPNRLGWWVVMGGLLLSLPPIWVGYFAAERYLYVASVGMVWMLCTLCSALEGHRILERCNLEQFDLERFEWFGQIGWASVLLWILGTGIVHWQRAMIWSSDRTLFAHAVEVLPTSGYAWHLQGMHLIQSGSFPEAFHSFRRATEQAHAHHQSAEFAIRSALEADLIQEAYEFAERGPQENLSRTYLEAWWMAAKSVQSEERAAQLERILGGEPKGLE